MTLYASYLWTFFGNFNVYANILSNLKKNQLRPFDFLFFCFFYKLGKDDLVYQSFVGETFARN
jgi:hypothetical protein